MIFINENLLQKGKTFIVNEKIKLKHPTVDEILTLNENEELFSKEEIKEFEKNEIFGENIYGVLIELFCSKPYDFMVDLDDANINYRDKEDYDIFLMLYDYERHGKIINWFFMGDYEFQHATNNVNGDAILYDFKNDIIIDKLLFDKISSYLKRINFLSSTSEFNPANEEARQMILDEKRRELKRMRNRVKKNESQLSTLVSFLVWNNTQGKDYEDIYALKIYQFHDGIRRISKTDNYKNIMLGYYTGNISGKEIKFEAIDWMTKTTQE